MVNRQKKKGSKWERDLANLLNKLVKSSKWKKVPGSGALGTLLNESRLLGDVRGSVDWVGNFLLEAKVGYGGEKQLTIKKEWFDKVSEDAKAINAIPAVACKFHNARAGTRYFIALDLYAFVQLLNDGTALLEELEKLYDKYEEG